MCTWNGCPHRATVTLDFGRCTDSRRPDPAGPNLLRAPYCDAHATEVDLLYKVEQSWPVRR